MDKRTRALYEKAMIARDKYQIGAITRDDATKAIAPYLKHANSRGKEIARRHGRKFRPFSLAEFLR